MITCRDLAELLDDLVSGELATERRAHVDDHLTNCSSCVAYVESYRLTMRLARRLPRLELPDHLDRRLQDVLQRPPAEAEGGSSVA